MDAQDARRAFITQAERNSQTDGWQARKVSLEGLWALSQTPIQPPAAGRLVLPHVRLSELGLFPAEETGVSLREVISQAL